MSDKKSSHNANSGISEQTKKVKFEEDVNRTISCAKKLNKKGKWPIPEILYNPPIADSSAMPDEKSLSNVDVKNGEEKKKVKDEVLGSKTVDGKCSDPEERKKPAFADVKDEEDNAATSRMKMVDGDGEWFTSEELRKPTATGIKDEKDMSAVLSVINPEVVEKNREWCLPEELRKAREAGISNKDTDGGNSKKEGNDSEWSLAEELKKASEACTKDEDIILRVAESKMMGIDAKWSTSSSVIELICLLPNGLLVNAEVEKTATYSEVKNEIWKEAAKLPLFRLLQDPSDYDMYIITALSDSRRIDDYSRRLCDLKPMFGTIKLQLKGEPEDACVLDEKPSPAIDFLMNMLHMGRDDGGSSRNRSGEKPSKKLDKNAAGCSGVASKSKKSGASGSKQSASNDSSKTEKSKTAKVPLIDSEENVDILFKPTDVGGF